MCVFFPKIGILRRSHNAKVVGSNPPPATNLYPKIYSSRHISKTLYSYIFYKVFYQEFTFISKILYQCSIIAESGVSGDLLQSMACGQMLGATPKKLQISMVFGVLAISGVIGLIIGVLH